MCYGTNLGLFIFCSIGVGIQDFMLAKQTLYHLSHTSSPFCVSYFGNGISRTLCLGCSHTIVPLISASQVATGLSHWRLDPLFSFILLIILVAVLVPLSLEPLCQPFFVKGFFDIGVLGTICPAWL
jgi:hypothetical protein